MKLKSVVIAVLTLLTVAACTKKEEAVETPASAQAAAAPAPEGATTAPNAAPADEMAKKEDKAAPAAPAANH